MVHSSVNKIYTLGYERKDIVFISQIQQMDGLVNIFETFIVTAQVAQKSQENVRVAISYIYRFFLLKELSVKHSKEHGAADGEDIFVRWNYSLVVIRKGRLDVTYKGIVKHVPVSLQYGA